MLDTFKNVKVILAGLIMLYFTLQLVDVTLIFQYFIFSTRSLRLLKTHYALIKIILQIIKRYIILPWLCSTVD